MMGLIEPNYRLPMCPPQPHNQAKIEAVLKSAGLLPASAPASRSTHAD